MKSGVQVTALEVIAGDGSQIVVVNRMSSSSTKLTSAAKMLGTDKTQIGIESIAPPFGAGYVALVAQGGGRRRIREGGQRTAASRV